MGKGAGSSGVSGKWCENASIRHFTSSSQRAWSVSFTSSLDAIQRPAFLGHRFNPKPATLKPSESCTSSLTGFSPSGLGFPRTPNPEPRNDVCLHLQPGRDTRQNTLIPHRFVSGGRDMVRRDVGSAAVSEKGRHTAPVWQACPKRYVNTRRFVCRIQEKVTVRSTYPAKGVGS